MISVSRNSHSISPPRLQVVREALISVKNRSVAAVSCCFPVRQQASRDNVLGAVSLISPSSSSTEPLTWTPESSFGGRTIQLARFQEIGGDSTVSERPVISCRALVEMSAAAKYAERKSRSDLWEYQVLTQLQILQKHKDLDFVYSSLDSLAQEVYREGAFNEEQAAEFCEDLEGYSELADFFVEKFSSFSFPKDPDVSLDIQARYLELRNPPQEWMEEKIGDLRSHRDQFIALSARIERFARDMLHI